VDSMVTILAAKEKGLFIGFRAGMQP